MQTIPQKFKETVARFPHRPALKFKYQGAYLSITFSELLQRVETLAQGLRSLGVVKGSKVAILSENRSEWVRTDLAALTLGAITIPLHTTLSAKIIKHILSDSDSEFILVSNQDLLNKLLLSIHDLPTLRVIICIQPLQLPNGEVTKKNDDPG